jgi:DNA-binding NarL/FixJ family response regulator
MDIETAPGGGTRITLTAPLGLPQRPTDETVSEEATDERAGPAIHIRRRPEVCRVLIVDDHAIVREGLAELFQFESDIEVVGQAHDGPHAIQLAEELRPDVVVMDVNLGDMTGVDATRQMLCRNPRLKVVGLSMHADDEVALAMRDAGASAYLTKGGPAEDLIATIRACFRE